MTRNDEHQNFSIAINQNPADLGLREIYVDWLEEHGEETRGWRWLNEHQKCPEDLRPRGWGWWTMHGISRFAGNRTTADESRLPGVVLFPTEIEGPDTTPNILTPSPHMVYHAFHSSAFNALHAAAASIAYAVEKEIMCLDADY